MIYKIIIPTLGKDILQDCLKSLHMYTHIPYTVMLAEKGNTWAEAVNIGIDRFPNEDVILMDDDIRVTEKWIDKIEKYKKQADIIAWTLMKPSGDIQFSGCYLYKTLTGTFMGNFRDKLDAPRETPNATTSCIYIKRKVFDKIGAMDNETYKEGCHFEDSDFCMRAKKAGFKIIVIPEIVWHLETATKKDFPNFKERVGHNALIFYTKLNNDKEYLAQLQQEGFLK
jgi:hypothetical protein